MGHMRLWAPFYNKPDDTSGSGGAPDDAADGFSSESASVAFTEAPTDTTAGIEGEAPPSEASASAEGVNDQPEEQPEAKAEASASVVAKPAEKPGPGTKAAASKPARKPSDRVAALTKEIDTPLGRASC